MEVILIDKVVTLGNFGDRISVKAGYARNFLIPRGKAVPATKENIEYFKIQRAEFEAKLAKSLEIASIRAEKINALGTVNIVCSKVGKTGKLFGSIGARDIAHAVTMAGIEVTKHEVRLPNGVLRTIGEHEVNFQFHRKLSAKLIINIVSK